VSNGYSSGEEASFKFNIPSRQPFFFSNEVVLQMFDLNQCIYSICARDGVLLHPKLTISQIYGGWDVFFFTIPTSPKTTSHKPVESIMRDAQARLTDANVGGTA
jgi:hypothetical protein